jgi:calcium-binding protein CML
MGVGQSKGVEGSQPSKIERRMVKAMAEKAQSGQFSLKSFNSIIMKFHKIDESFEAVRIVFRKYGIVPTFQVCNLFCEKQRQAAR